MALLPTSVPANFSATAAYGDQNTTNGINCSQKGEWVFTVLPVCILLISALGIVFNVFVLTVFCHHKKDCSVAEIYLSNLAAADLVLVVFLPFWAVSVSRHFHWPFSVTLCKLVNPSIHMSACCSIYFLVLISIDRFLALVYPLSSSRLRRPKYAKLNCVLVWFFNLLISVPMLMYRKVINTPHSNMTLCHVDFPNLKVHKLYEGILTTLTFIIPIFIIFYCTFKVIQALNMRLNSKQTEHKATVLVLAVVLAFLICWIPFHLIRIAEMLVRAEISTHCSLTWLISTLRQIFICLAFSNSVINPVLYVIVGKNFRQKVREMFKPKNGRTTLNTPLTCSNTTASLRLSQDVAMS